MAQLGAVDFLDVVRRSGLIEPTVLDDWSQQDKRTTEQTPEQIASELIKANLLTPFQSRHLLAGKHKGFVISGKYKVLDLLGSGGMGKVFLCEHLLLRTRVAVKTLPVNKITDRESIERFYREARAFATLNHPNLVRGFDVDSDDKLHFIVMEYVEGVTIQDWVDRDGPLAPQVAANLIRQAAAGLQHAHERGWVHRDIKPSNLIVDGSGLLKILDLGLARLLVDRNDQLTQQLSPNAIMGTADYLPPEQSQDSQAVDIRGDIYSLGCTFFMMLTGKPPFSDGTTTQKLLWHQVRPAPNLSQIRSDLPPVIAQVVQKMLAKNPSDRFQTPQELVQILSNWAADTPGPRLPEERREATGASVASMSPGSQVSLAPRHGRSTEGNAASSSTGLSRVFPPPTAAPAPRSGSASAVSVSSSGVITPPPLNSSSVITPPPLPVPTSNSSVALADLPLSESGSKSSRISEMSSRVKKVLTNPVKRWYAFTFFGIAAIGFMLVVGRSLVSKKPSENERFSETMLVLSEADEGAIQIVSLRNPRVKVIFRSDDGKRSKEVLFPAGKSIRDAIQNANAGTRIIVLGQTVIEQLDIDAEKNSYPARITIEGRGVNGTISLQARAEPEKPMFSFRGVRGWTVKGFRFDGEDTHKQAIAVQGYCPGLTISDCSFTRFVENGILLDNASGEADEPMALTRLEFLETAATVKSIVRCGSAAKESATKHLILQDSILTGPAPAAVACYGSVSYLDLKRNRFEGFKELLRFDAAGGPTPPERLRFTFASNTVARVGTAFRFAVMPSPEGSGENRAVVKSNLFFQVPKVTVFDMAINLQRASAFFPDTEGNVCDGTSNTEGDPVIRGLRQTEFELPLDKSQGNFLLYPPTSPLAQLGPGKTPVGVLSK